MRIPFLKSLRSKSLPVEYTGRAGWESVFGFPSVGWRTASEIWSDPTPSDFENAYYNNAVVRACVDKIGNTVSEPKIIVGIKKKTGEFIEVQSSPIIELLSNPNDEVSSFDFLFQIAARRALTGVAYVVKLRNDIGEVVSLHCVPSSFVSPLRGNGGRPWEGFRLSGQERIFPVEDIIVINNFAPDSNFVGVSCLQSAYNEYRIDITRQNYQGEMIENLKVPSMTLRTDNALSDREKKEIRAEFDMRFGKGNRGRNLMFISGNGQLLPSNPLADIDWPGITSLTETRICMAFGVSPLVIHSRSGLDRSTYSNYEGAQKAFYLNTMKSVWNALASALTRGLCVVEGEPLLSISFAYDDLPAFKESQDSVVARSAKLVEDRIITPEEARIDCGYNPDVVVGEFQTVVSPSNV